MNYDSFYTHTNTTIMNGIEIALSSHYNTPNSLILPIISQDKDDVTHITYIGEADWLATFIVILVTAIRGNIIC